MLNSLPLIIVMISSLFLAFYCVDSHKDNIVTLVNMDEKSIESVSVKVEENLTKQEVKVLEPAEDVYVEVLAVEDINDTSKIVEKVESKSEIVVEESIPVEVEKVEIVKEVKSIKNVEVIEEVEPKKAIDDKVTSEYSEGYRLDELEKMIMEELKKGNKD